MTRSLSNIIKYPFVDMRGKEAVIIDNNKDDAFVPLFDGQSKSVTIPKMESDSMQFKTISQIEAEKALQAELAGQVEASDTDRGFRAGLPKTDFDHLLEERQKEAQDTADQLIDEARKRAEKITGDAQIAADAARASGYEEGKSQGYTDGMAAAEQEIQQKEAELAENARMQREEFASCVAEIEVRYVDIVIALVRKLTGVVIEGRDDLILYLIRTAAQELEPSHTYKVRVSADDVYYLEAHQTEIADSIGDDVSIEFIGEKGLEKGQCILETDSQMVDCGFQTQLDMLVRDLKMLVN